jgi:predicted O-methyltransferase YrrM
MNEEELYKDIHLKSFNFMRLFSTKYMKSLVSDNTHDKAIRGLALYLFCESFIQKPKLIVELGTGIPGNVLTTNFIFEAIADMYDSTLITIDFNSEAKDIVGKRSKLILEDDISFAKRFGEYCKDLNIKPEIDLLFVDTDKGLEHLTEVIKYWFPLVKNNGKIIFHDTTTNTLKTHIQTRLALEKNLGIKIEENMDYPSYQGNWIVSHLNVSKGLTTLIKRNNE